MDILKEIAAELHYLKDMLFKSQESYRADLRANARALWSGVWDFFDFFVAMQASVQRGFTQAFYEGAATCGVRPDELSAEELARLQSEIVLEQQHITGLADFIGEVKARGGKLAEVFTRVELWVNGYAETRALAQMLVCSDVKLKWVLGVRLVHCRDCLMLNGRVYRAKIWAKYDIRPQHWDLECRGLHCGCHFEETDEPVTPGFPPQLSSRKELVREPLSAIP